MSPSPVLELQQDALDDKVSVSSLLRKAVAVASKLGISNADEWMKAELNDYPKEKPVPDYRMIFAERKAKHPFGGFLPVFGSSQKQHRVPVHEPIASIEDLTRSDEGQAMLPTGPINDDGLTFESFLVLNQTARRSVKDRVRSAVLEWALALEKKGISGDDLTFNLQEREAAKTIQNITYFTGPISGGAIVQNVDEGTANAATGARLNEVAELVRTARDRLSTLGLETEQAQEVTVALKRLDETTADKKPSKGKLLAGLSVLSENLKTGKAAADLQKPIHDLIEWATRLMS